MGFNDLKYYDALERVAEQARTRRRHPELVAKAEELLSETPGKILRHANDFRLADRFRREAVGLILALQDDR